METHGVRKKKNERTKVDEYSDMETCLLKWFSEMIKKKKNSINLRRYGRFIQIIRLFTELN